MPRPLVGPDARIEGLRNEMDTRVRNYDAQIRVQTDTRDQEVTEYSQRISALETLREPQIGPGQMPYLIMVEWFTEGELREHGHMCGRTVRDNDSQVWTLYNAQTSPVVERTDWITMVENYLLRANQSVRLQDVQSYVEFGRHCSRSGKVAEFPDFAGKSDLAPKPVFETLDVKADGPAPVEQNFSGQRFYVPARLLAGDVALIQKNPNYVLGESRTRRNYYGYGLEANTEGFEYVVLRDKSVENSARS